MKSNFIFQQNPESLSISCSSASSELYLFEYDKTSKSSSHLRSLDITVSTGAQATFVIFQKLNHRSSHQLEISARLHDSATLSIFVIELGAAVSQTNCHVQLEGVSSQLQLYPISLATNRRKIVSNYHAVLSGPKSQAHIAARSILLDTAQKNLQQSIDFISGAKGAKGSEEERVLILSPKAKNISSPIILCGENEVEGSHALSSGNIDPKALFYLASRGIDDLAAKKILSRASISDLLERIPISRIRNEIVCQLDKAMERA